METLQRVELIKDMVQQAIDRGAASVEQIHQFIADLPFEALERSGLLEDDRLGLREEATAHRSAWFTTPSAASTTRSAAS